MLVDEEGRFGEVLRAEAALGGLLVANIEHLLQFGRDLTVVPIYFLQRHRVVDPEAVLVLLVQVLVLKVLERRLRGRFLPRFPALYPNYIFEIDPADLPEKLHYQLAQIDALWKVTVLVIRLFILLQESQYDQHQIPRAYARLDQIEVVRVAA